MVKQLHKKFPNEQVKSLLKRYLLREIKVGYILEILGIKRRRFFELLKRYREDPENFFIAYKREKSTRMINKEIEEKWHLITSLDDYSRNMLYADFVEQETSWDHILALESTILRYGLPYKYYVDSHNLVHF